MPDKYYADGEVLPWKLAEAWAAMNNEPHTSREFHLYEIQMRDVIEAGIEAGVIVRRVSPSYAPCRKEMIFEDCTFEWGEVRAWAEQHLGEQWPVIPPWRQDHVANADGGQLVETVAGISQTEREKLLRQIGALTLLLAEKSNLYKISSKPNAKQIAEGVGQILAAWPDSNKRGVGDSSLRESIKEGIKLLEK